MPRTPRSAPEQRGAATTLILLILRDRPSYGYELVREIRRRSQEMFNFAEGTIYPLLYGLEEDGSIVGSWDGDAGGRRRRVYRLTPAGRQLLKQRLDAWEHFALAMRTSLLAPKS